MHHTAYKASSFLILFMASVVGHPLAAAEHHVSSSVGTFNCATNVAPGDIVTLAAGERGPLRIVGCKGTKDEPITIRNDPNGNGPTIIRRASPQSGGFVFDLQDLEHVIVDGTGKWRGASGESFCGVMDGQTDCGGCGIKVTSIASGDSPSHYVKLRGSTNRDNTLRGIEIDGKKSSLNTGGVGLNVGDSSVAWNGSNWIEGLTFENMCARRVHGEGFYIGGNWKNPPEQGLRRTTVRNVFVADTGREGIQLKSLWAGSSENMNRVHNNVVQRTGQRYEEIGMGACYSVLGCYAELFNNIGEECGVQGIQFNAFNMPKSSVESGQCPHIAYNNVLWRIGVGAGRENSGYGIGSTTNTDVVVALRAYNNTIVSTRNSGIQAGLNPGSQDAHATNNIIADCCGSSGSPLAINSAYKESNNVIGSAESLNFRQASSGSFRLQSDSPAVDSGNSQLYSSADITGIQRPQRLRPDVGAYEYTDADPPRPPPGVEVK